MSKSQSKDLSFGEANRRATGIHRVKAGGEASDGLPEDLDINADWQRVLTLIQRRCPVMFVTGRAGTGKSTLIHYIRREFSGNCVVLARTGVAALNVGGQTIHSFFGFPPTPIVLERIRAVENRRLYRRIDLLIIDEVSMVEADLLDAVDRFLRINTDRDQIPFGGVQTLLVGDLFQLPPVVKTEDMRRLYECRYSSEFFFSAHCLDDVPIALVELEHVYRQSDLEFIALLDNIREGRDRTAVANALNEACHRPGESYADAPVLTPTNAAAHRINRRRMDELSDSATVFEGELSGRFEIQRDRLPSPYKLQLCVGARVMFTKNDVAHRWVNGSLGVVTDIEEDAVIVEIDRRNGTAQYPVTRETWDCHEYFYSEQEDWIDCEVIGQYRQLPLAPAWAMTIHKGQGLTLDRVSIDLGSGAFLPGQTYVALSRCRELAGIRLLRPVRESDIRADERVLRFHKQIRRASSSGEHASDDRSDVETPTPKPRHGPSDPQEAETVPVSPNLKVTDREAYELGAASDPAAVPRLIELLTHTRRNTRRLAASALRKLRDKRAVVALIALVARERHNQVRQYAIAALGEIGDPRALDTLRRVHSDKDEKLYNRMSAEAAIHRIESRARGNKGSRNEVPVPAAGQPTAAHELHDAAESPDAGGESSNRDDVILRLVIELIQELQEELSATTIARILCGSNSKSVQAHRHHHLWGTFAGSSIQIRNVRAVIRRAVSSGVLRRIGHSLCLPRR